MGAGVQNNKKSSSKKLKCNKFLTLKEVNFVVAAATGDEKGLLFNFGSKAFSHAS